MLFEILAYAGFLAFFILLAVATGITTGKRASDQTPDQHAGRSHGQSPHQDRFWRWLLHDASGFFTFLLVGVGSLQAWLFVFQFRLIREGLSDGERAAKAAEKAANAAEQQASLARDSLIASNRAWIKPTIGIEGNLIIVETGAFANITVELENIGNSVAQDIRCEAWLLAPKTREAGFPRDESVVPLHRELCDRSRKRPRGPGFMLFPGERFPERQGFSLYSVTAMMGAGDLARLSFVSIENGNKVIPLNVGGAINYRFPSDDGVHQSSFLYELTYRGITAAFDLTQRLVSEEYLGLHGLADGDGRQAD